MQITIAIQKELRNTLGGVYMICFSNGYFYIGASKAVYKRIQTQCGCIKSGFTLASTVKSLKRMKGFEGTAAFFLLEQVDCNYSGFGLSKTIIDRETFHKSKHLDSPYLLNKVETLA